MTDHELIRKAFGQSALFEGMPLDKGWLIKDFSKGEEISERQGGIDCLGIIIKGSAQVTPGDSSEVSRLGIGDEFGICNIFISEKMPTSVAARSSICRVAFLPKDDFAQLLSQNSVLMYRYVKLCNEKMVYLANKLRLMSIPGCEERLIFWLRHNSTESKKITKDELAKRLGISRASLFRCISSLEKRGIISANGHSLSLNIS